MSVNLELPTVSVLLDRARTQLYCFNRLKEKAIKHLYAIYLTSLTPSNTRKLYTVQINRSNPPKAKKRSSKGNAEEVHG